MHDGSAGAQSRQLRSASSINSGSRTPVKMTERQQEAFVRNQPVQLRPLSGHACTEQKSVGQPVVQPQMNSSDVQIVKEIYEPSIGRATEVNILKKSYYHHHHRHYEMLILILFIIVFIGHFITAVLLFWNPSLLSHS